MAGDPSRNPPPHRKNSLRRRDFLKHTAAASAATGLFGSFQILQAGESANERVNVAVMGTNGRGGSLARGFAASKNSRVTYICDVDRKAVDKGMAEVLKLQSDSPTPTDDVRKVLEDKKVDVLVIAAPDHWHGPAAIMACAAGKHVYVEKPACHNGQEGEWMIAASRKHKRVVQVGTQRRSSAGLVKAFARMHEGELGRVLFARGWINSTRPNIGFGKQTAPPAHLNYELWQGPAPERPFQDNLIHYNWHWFWHWGTGELGNNGIHALDMCRWGMKVDYPTSAICGGGKFFFKDDQETPDTQLATFNFGDKAITWEHRTWNKRGFEGNSFGVVFYGDKGNLVVTENKAIFHNPDGKPLDEIAATYSDGEHIENFLSCIRENKRPNADVAEGVASTALCHLGNIAYRTGKTVRFDPKNRKILDDAEAEKLWHREYRPGWEPKF